MGEPFDSDDYLFEIKWDGTRTLAFIDNSGYRLVNRRRVDMTERYPEFSILSQIEPGTVLDGEVIVMNKGKSDFSSLMSREQARTPMKFRNLSRAMPATFVAFDVMYDRFQPIMEQPLLKRRERLKEIVEAIGHPQFVLSDGVVGKGKAFFKVVAEREMEGVMAKRLESRYLPGQRTEAWIKIKRGEDVTCLVFGFLPSGPDDFRSLILAAEQDGKLHYVGKVGTGFTNAMRKKINAILWSTLVPKPIIPCNIKGKWIEPKVYCLVHCMERTASGHLRAPAFKGLLDT
jgi:DNA ligase D-like protein (predicted ligase)